MQTFTVKGQTGLSSIYVGESLTKLENYLPDGHGIIVTDTNIKKLYGHLFPDLPIIAIGTGEQVKTLATVETILREFLNHNCDRSTFVVGIGGGIVTDITGFAASIFLRGLRFGFVSTSLLSQVDASVGGKNGVNLDSYKNMAGVFSQPEFVLCDIDLLTTLPENEISNGMAEIVKHALISDSGMFSFLEENGQKALDLDRDTIYRLVADSVKIKSNVVQNDEKESGERRKLNFGHTIGHAIEKQRQDGHGRAVSMGMMAAIRFSQKKGWINQAQIDRIQALLSDLHLPVNLTFPPDKIIDAVLKDKKKQGDSLFYVFLEKIGRARVEKISYTQMNRFINEVFDPKSTT